MTSNILLVVLASTALVGCIPPPHPAVVAVRRAEELLPPHQRSPALRNPHLLQTLELTSLLHNGEKPVFEREADNVSRKEIYNILTHAGLIGRHQVANQFPSQYGYNHLRSHDPLLLLNPDLLQYL